MRSTIISAVVSAVTEARRFDAEAMNAPDLATRRLRRSQRDEFEAHADRLCEHLTPEERALAAEELGY